MVNYYIALQSRAHAFLLERRLKDEGVECEISFIPRTVSTDLCNIGVRFKELEFRRAVLVIKRSALPGSKLYKEIIYSNYSQYEEVNLT